MSEQENTRSERWRAALSETERARVEGAFAADADLEGDLEALASGLSPERRAVFLQRFVANLARAERGQGALLLALGDLSQTNLTKEGREVTGFGDTPPEQTTR